jgi:hypothetical protein
MSAAMLRYDDDLIASSSNRRYVFVVQVVKVAEVPRIIWKLLVLMGTRERTFLMVIPECGQLTIISPDLSHQPLSVSEQRRLCQSFAAPLSCNIAM